MKKIFSKSRMARIFAPPLAFFLIVGILFAGCAKNAAESKYSDMSMWAYYQVGEDKSADLFLVCPTVDMGGDGNMNMPLDNDDLKQSFVGALNMERGIYEDTLTMYAPYYSQASFPVYSLTADEAGQYFDIAYQDVREAFCHFFENTPADRPFVLAGFSQGSDMVLRLLKEFFGDSAYQDRLIAAYCIGWRVTDDDLAECPWLKMAQAADDTGVIVSFNCEAESVGDSLIVPAGTKTHAINPLSWKTDGEYAPAQQNLGACFTNYSGEITSEIAGITGAYIDEARGTLKTPDIHPEEYSNRLFPDGVYHLYDYQFFYRNLQQNVAVRTEAYLAACAAQSAA